MADMIIAAGIDERMRMLETGTGTRTRWNAAILATLLGDMGAVTSVEIGPA